MLRKQGMNCRPACPPPGLEVETGKLIDPPPGLEDLCLDMTAHFRPPPGLTLEIEANHAEPSLAKRLSGTFQKMSLDEDTSPFLEPDFGPPPGLTIDTSAVNNKVDGSAWCVLSLQLAGVVADLQSEEMDM